MTNKLEQQIISEIRSIYNVYPEYDLNEVEKEVKKFILDIKKAKNSLQKLIKKMELNKLKHYENFEKLNASSRFLSQILQFIKEDND